MNEDQQPVSLESLLVAAKDNARRGKLSDAEAIINNIREATRVELQPTLIIGIMIIEGCIYSYRADWKGARDRLLRAQALAASQRKIGLEVEALAWLAFVAFNEGELKTAASRATQVLRWRESASPFTLYRATSVIAFLYFLADRPEAADQWLRFSKRMAELAGSPSAISSIIFAAAALRASSERVRRALGGLGTANLDLELLFSRSAQNYDAMTSVTVMPALHKLQEAQVLNMMGDFAAARDLLVFVLRDPLELPSISSVQAKLELFWCRWSLSPDSLQRSELEEAMGYVNEFLEDDDIIVYSSRLMVICRKEGWNEYLDNLMLLYESARERFVQEQKSVLDDLADGLLKAGISATESVSHLIVEAARGAARSDKSNHAN